MDMHSQPAAAAAIRSLGLLASADSPASRPRANVLATLADAPAPAFASPSPSPWQSRFAEERSGGAATGIASRSAQPLTSRGVGVGGAAGSIGGSSMRASRKPESGEASDEGTDEGDAEAEVFGQLKTQLVWDCAGRRLCLSAKQYAETPRKLEVKARGMLDAASGQHRVWGHLRRNFYTHVPLLQRLVTAQAQRQAGRWVDEPELDPEAFLPGGLRCLLFQDWAIAPGLSYDTARAPPLPPAAAAAAAGGSSGGGASASSAAAGLLGGLALGQRTRYQLAIKKNPQVIKNTPQMDLFLTARALAEFDPKASEVTLGGGVRLKAVRYGITGSQDLKMTVGLDVVHDEAGRLRRMPYVNVGDGKLSARLQNRRWQLMYNV